MSIFIMPNVYHFFGQIFQFYYKHLPFGEENLLARTRPAAGVKMVTCTGSVGKTPSADRYCLPW